MTRVVWHEKVKNIFPKYIKYDQENTTFSTHNPHHPQIHTTQECIPVGCIPSATVAVSYHAHPLPCIPPPPLCSPEPCMSPPTHVDRILDTRL